MVSWVFAYAQTCQIVHIIYVNFTVYQLYLNRAVKDKLISEKECKGNKGHIFQIYVDAV